MRYIELNPVRAGMVDHPGACRERTLVRRRGAERGIVDDQQVVVAQMIEQHPDSHPAKGAPKPTPELKLRPRL